MIFYVLFFLHSEINPNDVQKYKEWFLGSNGPLQALQKTSDSEKLMSSSHYNMLELEISLDEYFKDMVDPNKSDGESRKNLEARKNKSLGNLAEIFHEAYLREHFQLSESKDLLYANETVLMHYNPNIKYAPLEHRADILKDILTSS